MSFHSESFSTPTANQPFDACIKGKQTIMQFYWPWKWLFLFNNMALVGDWCVLARCFTVVLIRSYITRWTKNTSHRSNLKANNTNRSTIPSHLLPVTNVPNTSLYSETVTESFLSLKNNRWHWGTIRTFYKSTTWCFQTLVSWGWWVRMSYSKVRNHEVYTSMTWFSSSSPRSWCQHNLVKSLLKLSF